MDHPEGEGADRVDFDRQVRLEFRGTQPGSDGGLTVMRELDDAPGLSGLASSALCDSRPGKHTVHRLDRLFRQSVCGRFAGCEDVNDADRLALDPVIRQIVGRQARGRCAGSLGVADGPVRDRYAGHAREPGGFGRSQWPSGSTGFMIGAG